jgi:hypothetical protein
MTCGGRLARRRLNGRQSNPLTEICFRERPEANLISVREQHPPKAKNPINSVDMGIPVYDNDENKDACDSIHVNDDSDSNVISENDLHQPKTAHIKNFNMRRNRMYTCN